jgi:hypothetical protein
MSGAVVVSRLASLGHDVVAMVRDVQAASRRLPSGIALRVADYKDASALQRALAGIDDMVLISSDGDASSHAPSRQRHIGSYGEQHPAYYFHQHRRYRRVVAILLLTCRERRVLVEESVNTRRDPVARRVVQPLGSGKEIYDVVVEWRNGSRPNWSANLRPKDAMTAVRMTARATTAAARPTWRGNSLLKTIKRSNPDCGSAMAFPYRLAE